MCPREEEEQVTGNSQETCLVSRFCEVLVLKEMTHPWEFSSLSPGLTRCKQQLQVARIIILCFLLWSCSGSLSIHGVSCVGGRDVGELREAILPVGTWLGCACV